MPNCRGYARPLSGTGEDTQGLSQVLERIRKASLRYWRGYARPLSGTLSVLARRFFTLETTGSPRETHRPLLRICESLAVEPTGSIPQTL
jgi:hypothetical protein